MRTAGNPDGGRTRGTGCSGKFQKDVISFRTAFRIHTRISMVSGV